MIEPFVDRPIKILGSTIKESKEEVLLGVRVDSDLAFKEHVTSICSKANQKLHVLTGKLFITSQFNYCPIVWMCHSRSLNNKVNHIHERAFHIG